ncbi:hypothetical protein LJR219_003428 [Phenylobacterium sp. LjRoot219]|uniref:hypothetical protein n=1 Tax=Phenylobacterium sp. LjRoot219 TaxID=3342283 RepID=UPI003ECC7B7E
MLIDPFRWYRRRQRLQREALEESQYLRRRFGDTALATAREKLKRPDLTSWGRNVLEEAIKLLERPSTPA